MTHCSVLNCDVSHVSHVNISIIFRLHVNEYIWFPQTLKILLVHGPRCKLCSIETHDHSPCSDPLYEAHNQVIHTIRGIDIETETEAKANVSLSHGQGSL